jgi:acyl-CoA thioesterase
MDLEMFRSYFENDRYAALTGVEIESVEEGGARCSLALDERHSNAAGGVHGGAIFTLADLALAVHCNEAFVQGEAVGVTVAQSISVSFLKPPKGSVLVATSALLSKGRTVSVYRVSVSDELGTRVAEMQANVFTTQRRGQGQ